MLSTYKILFEKKNVYDQSSLIQFHKLKKKKITDARTLLFHTIKNRPKKTSQAK